MAKSEDPTRRSLFADVDSAWHIFLVGFRLLILLVVIAVDTVRHYAVEYTSRSIVYSIAKTTKVGKQCVGGYPDNFLAGKTCLLTGVTSGIGLAALRRILALPKYKLPRRIIILTRETFTREGSRSIMEDSSLEELMVAISARGIELKSHVVDLACPVQVSELAQKILSEESCLDLLLSNAGCWRTENVRTTVGFKSPESDGSSERKIEPVSDVSGKDLETHFVVNYLATFLLVESLRPLLEASAERNHVPARIVITGSFTAFDIAGGVARLTDLQLSGSNRGSVHFALGPPSAPALKVRQAMGYAHSKLLLHMYATYLGDKVLDPKRVRVVVVDPGIVNTKLHSSIKDFFGPHFGGVIYHVAGNWLRCLRTPEEGSAPLVHCCVRRDLPEPVASGMTARNTLFCDWGRTYLHKRELSFNMACFPGSELGFLGWFGRDAGLAVAQSLADSNQCKQLYEHTEQIRVGLCSLSCEHPGVKTQIFPQAEDADVANNYTANTSMFSCWARFFYIDVMAPLSDFLPHCPPGPPLLPFRYVINFQKGGTLVFCLFLMAYAGNYSHAAWLYTATHGSYGLCWLLKDAYFRDPKTDEVATFLGNSILVTILLIYWYIPFIVITGRIEVSAPQQAISVGFSMVGTVIMMVADCHKYFALKYNAALAQQKRFLIQDGLFETNRNPNYLGEIMVYVGFVLFTGPRPEVVVVIISLWVVLFGTNMAKKDISLEQKPGWNMYRERSWLVFFKFNWFSSN